MNIAIIGGGLTGLTAAYELTKAGHKVTLFERETFLGGLAHGFKPDNWPATRSSFLKEKSEVWSWSLEAAYHHFFTNDYPLIKLVEEIGLSENLIIKRPITATLINYRNEKSARETEDGSKFSFATSAFPEHKYKPPSIFQLDSPASLFKFPQLSLLDKIRTAALLGFCKINPFWQPLENLTAESFIKFIGGENGWKIIWEPLLYGKFGNYSSTIAASWFWARIQKRTLRLGYIKGGFQTLISALENAILHRGGIIRINTAVTSISNIKNKNSNIQIKYQIGKNNKEHIDRFDCTLITVPTPIAVKLVPQFDISNFKSQIAIPHLHAQILILETDHPILKDVYWLNINDRSFPFLAVVAHTNFMDKKYYGGRHLTYFGNYLPDNHPYLKMSKSELFKLFLPFIKKINPDFRQQFNNVTIYQFNALYAQPVHQLHYSKSAPKLDTPIPGLYLANLDSIYPWDRGTNYAVELGEKAAKSISTCHQ